MNKLKYMVMAGAGYLFSLPSVWAQSQSNPIDLSAAETATDNIGSAISGLLTGKVMTNVLLVVAAGLGLWAIFFVIRYIKRGGKQ